MDSGKHHGRIKEPDRRKSERQRKKHKHTFKMSNPLHEELVDYAREHDLRHGGELNLSEAIRELLQNGLYDDGTKEGKDD